MLVDANLLLYAALEDFPQHEAAREWLDEQLNGPRRVGLPWPDFLSFVGMTSYSVMFSSPLSTLAAWMQIRGWLPCRMDSGALGAPLRDPGRPARRVQGDGPPRAGRTPGGARIGARPVPLQHR